MSVSYALCDKPDGGREFGVTGDGSLVRLVAGQAGADVNGP